MIYNFEDYINELWTKGLTRKKNDEHRLEDKNPVNQIIKILGEYIADKLNIKYFSDICKLIIDKDYPIDYVILSIRIPYSSSKYLKHYFSFVIENPYKLYNDGYDKNEIYISFISEIFTYLNTHDYSYMNKLLISRETYEKIKNILLDFVNDMKSTYKLKIKNK